MKFKQIILLILIVSVSITTSAKLNFDKEDKIEGYAALLTSESIIRYPSDFENAFKKIENPNFLSLWKKIHYIVSIFHWMNQDSVFNSFHEAYKRFNAVESRNYQSSLNDRNIKAANAIKNYSHGNIYKTFLPRKDFIALSRRKVIYNDIHTIVKLVDENGSDFTKEIKKAYSKYLIDTTDFDLIRMGLISIFEIMEIQRIKSLTKLILSNDIIKDNTIKNNDIKIVEALSGTLIQFNLKKTDIINLCTVIILPDQEINEASGKILAVTSLHCIINNISGEFYFSPNSIAGKSANNYLYPISSFTILENCKENNMSQNDLLLFARDYQKKKINLPDVVTIEIKVSPHNKDKQNKDVHKESLKLTAYLELLEVISKNNNNKKILKLNGKEEDDNSKYNALFIYGNYNNINNQAELVLMPNIVRSSNKFQKAKNFLIGSLYKKIGIQDFFEKDGIRAIFPVKDSMSGSPVIKCEINEDKILCFATGIYNGKECSRDLKDNNKILVEKMPFVSVQA